MKSTMSTVSEKYFSGCVHAYTKFGSFVREHATLILFIVGVVLLSSGLAEMSHAQLRETDADYNDEYVRNAVGNLFLLIEGAFGALVMVIAGLGAIIAAAMGAYKAALGMLVVAVGAFILRSLVSLFFGERFDADA